MNEELHPITRSLKPIIEGMCSAPVSVTDTHTDSKLDIRVVPSQRDYAIVCGKAGRQIRALKFIVDQAGKRWKLNSSIQLEEPFDPQQIRQKPFTPNHKFNTQKFLALLNGISQYVFDPVPPMRVETKEDRIKVYFLVDKHDRESVVTVVALGDVFYPWGIAQGQKVEIKTPRVD